MKVKKFSMKVVLGSTLMLMNTIWGQNVVFPKKNTLETIILNNQNQIGKEKQSQLLEIIKNNLKITEKNKLEIINNFINQNIRYETDMQAWNQLDYWAAPMELLNNGAGDCEDFAIAKYYALKKMHVEAHKLRLVYVLYKSDIDDKPQPHMILSYTENEKILILDNLVNEIKTSDERKDLTPVFSLNDEGIFTELNQNKINKSLSKWTELVEKAKREGWE